MNKERIHSKINYLEEQLVSLNHFLPETYEYLMAELDAQRRLLAEIEVCETFQQIDALQGDALMQMGQDASVAVTKRDRDPQ
jgi:hypothetical protein